MCDLWYLLSFKKIILIEFASLGGFARLCNGKKAVDWGLEGKVGGSQSKSKRTEGSIGHDILVKSKIHIAWLLLFDQTEKSSGRFGDPGCHPQLHHKLTKALVEETSAVWGSILWLLCQVGIELSVLERV